MFSSSDEIVVDESIAIAAPTHQVWHAIVDAAARAAWWGYLDLDPRLGGRFEERWTDADGRLTRTHGQVIDLVEGRLLRLSWVDENWGQTTEVEVRVYDADDATSVRVRHIGWERLPDGAALAAEHGSGWKMHLENLRGHLEGTAEA